MGRRVRNRYLDQPEPAFGSMTALVKLGLPAVPALIKAMEDEAYDGRDLAVEALGRIGPGARDAIPALIRRFDTGNVPEKCRAVEAKWKIDGDAAFARERVVPLLDEEAGRECNGAGQTLALLGRDAVPAMPALIAALQRHQSAELLRTVAQLAPHAPDLAMPALRDALDIPALADYAAPELQSLGEPSAPLIAHQLKRLKACAPQDGTDPMRIVYTIVIHGPEAKGALGELTALLKHDTPAVRQAAAWGLPRIFAEEAPVIAGLQEALNDPAAAEEAARSLKMIEVARQ
jgi:HEAT repeat protein